MILKTDYDVIIFFHKLHLNIYMLYTHMYTNTYTQIYVYIQIYIYIYMYFCIQIKFVKWKLENASCPRSVAFTVCCEELNSQRPELVGLDPLAAVVAPGLAAHLVV